MIETLSFVIFRDVARDELECERVILNLSSHLRAWKPCVVAPRSQCRSGPSHSPAGWCVTAVTRSVFVFALAAAFVHGADVLLQADSSRRR